MTDQLSILKLNAQFDPVRLQRDLETAVSRFKSASQAGGYHDGSWKGISLRSVNGDFKSTYAITAADVEDTEVLEHCPYFKAILDALPFPVGVTRLLFLPPGKKIGEHRDQGLGWERGVIRLHIPIVTHPNVIFNIDGTNVNWKPGEFWYGDFCKPHHLHNRSDITRVHMVIDAMVSENTFDYFPSPISHAIKAQHHVLMHQSAKQVDRKQHEQLQGFFTIPGKFIGLPFSLRGRLQPQKNRLVAKIDGLPFDFSFSPINSTTYRQLEYELHFSTGNNNNLAAELVEHRTGKASSMHLSPERSTADKIKAGVQFSGLKSLFFIYHRAVSVTQQWKKVMG